MRILTDILLTYGLHSTLLLGVAWLLSYAFKALPVRDTLWKAALVGALLSSGFQLVTGWGVSMQPRMAPQLEAIPSAPFQAAPSLPETQPVSTVQTESQPSPAQHSPQQSTSPSGPSLPAWLGWQALLLGFWFLGLLFCGLRLVTAGRALRRRLASRRPLKGGQLPTLLADLCHKAGVRRRVRLTVSPELSGPVALGYREICLPERAPRDLSPVQQQVMLAHELAHLLRYDPWWLLLASGLETLFWFQPLGRFAKHQLKNTAEYLCDTWVVRHTGHRLELALCLAEVAGWLQGRASPLTAGMAGHSPLVRRVKRLLEGSQEMFTAQYKVQRLVLTLGLLALVSLGAPNVLLGQHGSTALAQSAQASDQNNLNLNFDIKSSKSDLPQGWTIIPNYKNPPRRGGASDIGLDANNAYSGSYSLRVRRETTLPHKFNFGGVGQIAPLNNAAKGKVIRLSGYIKTQDLQGGFAGLWMNVVGPSEYDELAFDNMYNQDVHGTTGWTRYQITLPVYDTAKKIIFGVLMNGTGTAWFDDLSIQVLNTPAANYPAFPLLKGSTTTPSHFWTDFAKNISSRANISQQTLQQQIDLLSSGIRSNLQTFQRKIAVVKEKLAKLKKQEAQQPNSDLEQSITNLTGTLAFFNRNLQQQEVSLKRQLAELKQKMADLKQQEAQHSSHGLEQSITVYQAVVGALEKLLARAGGMK